MLSLVETECYDEGPHLRIKSWRNSLEALAADIQVAEVIKTVRSKDCMELQETGKDIKKEQAGAGGS